MSPQKHEKTLEIIEKINEIKGFLFGAEGEI